MKKKQNVDGKIKVKKLIDLIREVQAEPEPKLLWKGIVENGHGLIVGPPKSGKTTGAENLAISMSVGRKEFMGFGMDGKPRKVLFINLEESYKLRARRNKKQMSNLNDRELELFSENFDTTDKEFLEFLNDEDDWIRLSNYIKASDAEVVFIDSLTNMFEGKIEDSTRCRKFIELFSKYLKSLDRTFIIVHHTTKNSGKLLDTSDVAGSRVILQYFEFIYGMAEIQTEQGGYYFCDIQNKHIEKDSRNATIYELNNSYWITPLGVVNKYTIYNEGKKYKIDGRYDDTNENLLYDYMVNQYNQGIQTVSTSTMMNDLVKSKNRIFSHDTLHKSKKKLLEKGKILKEKKGEFKINADKGRDRDEQ